MSKILTFLETLSFERKSLPSVQFSMLLFFTLWKVILTLSYVWMGVQEAIDPLIFKCVQFNNKALRLNSLFGTTSFDAGEFLHQSITTFFHDWIGWDEGVGLTSKTLLHWALNGLWQSHTRWWDLWWRPYKLEQEHIVKNDGKTPYIISVKKKSFYTTEIFTWKVALRILFFHSFHFTRSWTKDRKSTFLVF